MSVVGAFNTTLEEFLQDLVRLFPQKEHKIHVYKNGVERLRSMNSHLVLEKFMRGIDGYREQIATKNESFFLDCKKDSTLAQNAGHVGELSWNEMQEICETWSSLQERNKDILWKYVNNLCIYGDVYLKKQPDPRMLSA